MDILFSILAFFTTGYVGVISLVVFLLVGLAFPVPFFILLLAIVTFSSDIHWAKKALFAGIISFSVGLIVSMVA